MSISLVSSGGTSWVNTCLAFKVLLLAYSSSRPDSFPHAYINLLNVHPGLGQFHNWGLGTNCVFFIRDNMWWTRSGYFEPFYEVNWAGSFGHFSSSRRSGHPEKASSANKFCNNSWSLTLIRCKNMPTLPSFPIFFVERQRRLPAP